jgi:hypothetical protein
MLHNTHINGVVRSGLVHVIVVLARDHETLHWEQPWTGHLSDPRIFQVECGS